MSYVATSGTGGSTIGTSEVGAVLSVVVARSTGWIGKTMGSFCIVGIATTQQKGRHGWEWFGRRRERW